MGQVATITIGAVNYSVYSLSANPVQDADDFFAARVGSTWSTLTNLQKQQAIISAARKGDSVLRYNGTITVPGQPLLWPRDGARDNCIPEDVPDGTVPDKIAIGHFLLGEAIVLDPNIMTNPGTGSNVKQAKAGSAQVTFFTPTIGSVQDLPIPAEPFSILACFLASRVGVVAPSASGVDGESAFSPCDFERDDGFG